MKSSLVYSVIASACLIIGHIHGTITQDNYYRTKYIEQALKTGSDSGYSIYSCDKNHDDRISREEFPFPEERFNQFDKNHDGVLDLRDVFLTLKGSNRWEKK